jgi:acyl-CoA thioester hydrolase
MIVSCSGSLPAFPGILFRQSSGFPDYRKKHMSNKKLLNLYERVIPVEWIDYNGHLNVAYYVLAFDQATDAMLDYLGMDDHYRTATGCSVFVLECHVNYLQELVAGERIRCTTQILNADAKRIHYFHRMLRAEGEELVATTELILLHVSLKTRRGAPMPEGVCEKIQSVLAEHRQLPWPEQAGRVIGIRPREVPG